MSQGILLGGSGGYGTLPEQVSSFYAARGNAQVTLTWSNPSAEYAGTLIVRKTGGYPQRPSDGVKVYKGTATSCTDTGLTNDTQYYYRAFAYNSRGEYQTISRFATAKPIGYISLGALPVGSLLNINEDGVPTQYLIVHQGNPDTSIYNSSCNGTWVLRKEIKCQSYWKHSLDTSQFMMNDYCDSDINKYLCTTMFPEFSEQMQRLMQNAAVNFYETQKDLTAVIGTMQSRLFLLCGEEFGYSGYSPYGKIGSKLDYFETGSTESAKQKRKVLYNGAYGDYFTRENMGKESAGGVYADGSISNVSAWLKYWQRGVRPASIISNTANVSPSSDSSGCYTFV